jgi:hypothetical protein
MRIKNYNDFVDKQILDALKRTAKIVEEEYHSRMSYHEDIDPEKTYRAEKIHPASLLKLYGWTGIWNSLNTIQKIRVFRFVYKVENSEIIN